MSCGKSCEAAARESDLLLRLRQNIAEPAKCFLIGHDGKLKSLLKRVLRNELPLEAVPTEAVLRHREIKFIMGGPEYRRLVEVWHKAK